MCANKKFIDNLNELNYYLKHMDDGGIDYDLSLNEDNGCETITLAFYSNGGWSESIELFISFKHIYTFHLGISMRLSDIGVQIDEIQKKKLSDIKDLMPYPIHSDINTGCYRFYANKKPTVYYVICDDFLSWIEGYDKLNSHYKFATQI